MVTPLGHGALGKRWPKAPHGLIDAIVEKWPAISIEFEITTALRATYLMAQVSHECGGGTITEENLRYTAKRMVQVWPKRFPTISAAQPFAGNPKALANKVYNGRMGNRLNTNDGWDFRGRGLIQITGRDGYVQVGKAAGLDLVNHPEDANNPMFALRVAMGFWKWKNLNPWCDKANFLQVTKLINGGTTGYNDRLAWLNKWKGAFA